MARCGLLALSYRYFAGTSVYFWHTESKGHTRRQAHRCRLLVKRPSWSLGTTTAGDLLLHVLLLGSWSGHRALALRKPLGRRASTRGGRGCSHAEHVGDFSAGRRRARSPKRRLLMFAARTRDSIAGGYCSDSKCGLAGSYEPQISGNTRPSVRGNASLRSPAPTRPRQRPASNRDAHR
jgi:hypothetical protein